jgi:hypothetical protein
MEETAFRKAESRASNHLVGSAHRDAGPAQNLHGL